MDDEGDERRRRLKPEVFVRSNLESSCATPRHQWRSPSWNPSKPPTPFTTRLVQQQHQQQQKSALGCSSSNAVSLMSLSMREQQQQQPEQQQQQVKRPSMKLDLGALKNRGSAETGGDEAAAGAAAAATAAEEGSDADGDLEVRERRERLQECDKQCTRVMSHLYLGSKTVAENYALLRRCRITHIVNCVGMVCPAYFPDDFHYKTLCLLDSPHEDLLCVLYDVFDFIEDVRQQAGGRVMVHCCQGVSRSVALVVSYVMWRERRTFDRVLRDVKARRSVASPNIGFVFQLLQWQRRRLRLSSSQQEQHHEEEEEDEEDKRIPGTPLDVYRIAPHSSYDPLLLVPKVAALPAAGGKGGTGAAAAAMDSLDSRGVFLVRMPNRLYVWRGRGSDKPMAAAADRAAFQLVRYEHAQGPIVVVAEGREPPFLLNSLLKRAPTVAAAAAAAATASARFGYKLVAAYDADFDMYRRARTSGAGSEANANATSSLGDYNHSGSNPPTPTPALPPPLSARVNRWRVMRPEMSYHANYKW